MFVTEKLKGGAVIKWKLEKLAFLKIILSRPSKDQEVKPEETELSFWVSFSYPMLALAAEESIEPIYLGDQFDGIDHLLKHIAKNKMGFEQVLALFSQEADHSVAVRNKPESETTAAAA